MNSIGKPPPPTSPRVAALTHKKGKVIDEFRYILIQPKTIDLSTNEAPANNYRCPLFPLVDRGTTTIQVRKKEPKEVEKTCG